MSVRESDWGGLLLRPFAMKFRYRQWANPSISGGPLGMFGRHLPPERSADLSYVHDLSTSNPILGRGRHQSEGWREVGNAVGGRPWPPQNQQLTDLHTGSFIPIHSKSKRSTGTCLRVDLSVWSRLVTSSSNGFLVNPFTAIGTQALRWEIVFAATMNRKASGCLVLVPQVPDYWTSDGVDRIAYCNYSLCRSRLDRTTRFSVLEGF
jgi:hypothetical protein